MTISVIHTEGEMPKKYEAIRDKLLEKGIALKLAKTRAAKIYNAERKPGQKPVTGKKHK
jgi:hypothetical protein